ncbi:MAG: type II toxin-antitoxin system RelE/ParE family toxin [Candidatus Omnitrophota bacterium]|nr:type II toxin-antitoxin system RelE/ParE family toxin [Candidatus Omnitrophota bacterium]
MNEKGIGWIGSSKKDLKGFPEEVKQDIGYALYEVQRGRKPQAAKPLKGFGGAGILEIVENFTGGTYRAVYTVRFQKLIYVLHCFQKKSKHGIKTSQQDIDLIKQRMKLAEEDYKVNYR